MKGIIFFLLVGLTLTYDPSKGITYAKKYCKNYNKNYINYRNQGGDCANFVSQCLIAGGENLSGCGGTDKNLEACLSSKGWSHSKGINGSFKAGFPFFSPGTHAMIATSVSGSSLKFCAHTNDRCESSLTASSQYNFYYK